MKTTARITGGSYDKEQYKFINEGKEGNVYWRASYQKDIVGSYKDAQWGRSSTTFKRTYRIFHGG